MSQALLGQAYFTIVGVLALAGALITVAAKNPIRAAMGLLTTILSVAGLFLALHAEFLAAIQLIIYAGAIVVLFIFVIMLIGPSASPPRDKRGQIARSIGGAVFGLSFAGALFLGFRASRFPRLYSPDFDFGTVDAFGRDLFAGWLVPFELSSALLMVAVVGAIAVARGRQGEPPRVHTDLAPRQEPQTEKP